jgi:hypothetical protein
MVTFRIASPLAIAVTNPFADTAILLGVSVDHTNERPASAGVSIGNSNKSNVAAVNCRVPPTDSGAVVDDVMITLLIGITPTVMVRIPTFPSTMATTVAVPVDNPVTTPVADTEIFVLSLVDHTIFLPDNESRLPELSRSVNSNGVVRPTYTGVDELNTVVATGVIFTVTVNAADFPSLVAVIVAVPEVTPVIVPSALTDATAELELAHEINRFVST